MNYTCEAVGATTVVTLLDDALDSQSSKKFRHSMEAGLAGKGQVILDLRNVRFMDSSGLGAILMCMRLIEGGGGRLRLCGLSPDVRKSVELVRMDRLIDVYESRDEAFEALRDESATLGLET